MIYCITAILACCLGGCAPAVRDLAATAGSAGGTAAGATAPPALLKGLSTLNEPENQQRLQAVARSPAVRATSLTLGQGVGRGLVDELVAVATGVPATRPVGEDVPEGGATLPSDVGPKVKSFVRQNVDPAVAEMVRTAVREAMQAATNPDARAGASAMAEAVGDGAVRGVSRAARENGPMFGQLIREQLGPAMGDALRQQLGPALDQLSQRLGPAFHDFLQREVAPSVRQIWDQGATDALLIPTRPDVSPAVIQNAHNLSLGTGFGTHDSMVQMGMLSESGGPTGTAKVLFWGLVVVVALLGLAAIAALIVLGMIAISLWRRPIAGATAPRSKV